MTEPVNALKIHVKQVSKSYLKYRSEWQRFLAWFGIKYGEVAETRVLSDIDFIVNKGEAIALVGENGAGKSTLLKMITGTIAPSTGQIAIHGRVSAILELGLGFNPEMSGRQNVYLSAQVMGLRTGQIDQLMAQIQDFCELGDYFDEPIRTYSSGMNMRLAFSVVTAVRPEILIVDEALSVGDSYFQFKCINRIRRFLADGTTLLLVSHDLGAIKTLCERAVLIDGGRIIHDGSAADVTDLYQSLMLKKANLLSAQSQIAPDGVQIKASEDGKKIATTLISEAVFDQVDMQLLDSHLRPVSHLVTGEPLHVQITAQFKTALDDPHVGFGIRNKDGLKIYESNTYCLNQRPGPLAAMTPLTVTFSFDCHLGEGDFAFVVGLADGGFDRGSFNEVIYFEQDCRILKVICSDKDSWSGFFNLQPQVKLER